MPVHSFFAALNSCSDNLRSPLSTPVAPPMLLPSLRQTKRVRLPCSGDNRFDFSRRRWAPVWLMEAPWDGTASVPGDVGRKMITQRRKDAKMPRDDEHVNVRWQVR